MPAYSDEWTYKIGVASEEGGAEAFSRRIRE
jgi:hypothetical protein